MWPAVRSDGSIFKRNTRPSAQSCLDFRFVLTDEAASRRRGISWIMARSFSLDFYSCYACQAV